METLFPRANLSDAATPWGRTVQSAVVALERAMDRATSDNKNLNDGQSASIETLQGNVQDIRSSIDRLNSLSVSSYDEFTTGITAGGVGFIAAPVLIRIKSASGRLRLTYGGALNSGQGYYLFQVTGATSGVLFNRTVIQANPAKRVAITGGASFTPSGSTSVLIEVPPNENLAITLEGYSGLTGTYFAGGSILAEVAP